MKKLLEIIDWDYRIFYIKDFFYQLHYKNLYHKYIRPIKQFFFWGKTFSQSFDDEPWGDLYKFVMLKTEKFIDFSKTRESHYVGAGKRLTRAKILNETSKRLFFDGSWDHATPYDKRIKKLEDLWWIHSGVKKNTLIISFTIVEHKTDGSSVYTPVTGGIADEYRLLSKLQYKWLESYEKGLREIFYKNLKQFEYLDW